jgi:hypothetical protein
VTKSYFAKNDRKKTLDVKLHATLRIRDGTDGHTHVGVLLAISTMQIQVFQKMKFANVALTVLVSLLLDQNNV